MKAQGTAQAETEAGTSAATRWVRYTPETAPALAARVEAFQSLDVPAGLEAARFLKESALVNATMSRTHLCVTEERIEGFYSCCSGSVRLSGRSVKSLGLRTELQVMPAILLTWVARNREGSVTGREIISTAYALAREAADTIAATALILDPMDEAVSKLWQGAPYGFQLSEQTRGKKPTRLWLPLDPETPIPGT